ncbi:MAG: response regulator [Parcubacteria group bacterium]|nr:response regulator [Parcubacteria group bacterium]
MTNQPIVLIAEDDQFLSRMYATKLSGAGISVVVAEDGKQALDAARKQKPGLVLLDILMPKMDGFEVLAELKKDPNLKDVPVVLLTNLSEVDDVARAKKLGAAEYLIKAHFLPSEVLAVVRKYLTSI